MTFEDGLLAQPVAPSPHAWLGNLLSDAADDTHDVDAALSLVKAKASKDVSRLFWWVLDTLVSVKELMWCHLHKCAERQSNLSI